MKDKLVVTEECGVFRIRWLLAEDGDYGATLGDDPKVGKGPEPKDRMDWECWKASKTAAETLPSRDTEGYWWESHREAAGVLRLVREALKQDRPLPEWAQKALTEGWKPPKWWKA